MYLAFDGGYDPEWSDSSPGRFLQTRILKDLFAHDRPAEIDFGFGDNHYKSSLSTHQHGEVNVCLLPRSARSAVRLRHREALRRRQPWLGRHLVSAVSSVPTLRRRLRSAAPAAALGLDLASEARALSEALAFAAGL